MVNHSSVVGAFQPTALQCLFTLAVLRKLFDLVIQVRFLESSALSANSSADFN